MANASNTFTSGSSGEMRTVADPSAARNNASENSGLVMISAPFNSNNWLTWNRSVRIALEGKDKLGFIDGSYVKPTEGAAEIKQCGSRIHWELSSISQGNLSVTAYYTKLKQYWDELVCLKPPAMCSCGRCICDSNKAKTEEIEENQLMQFLMGLSEPYDSIRSQILVLNSFPSVNKAYSMVLRVERQRRVNLEYADVGDNSAMSTRNTEYKFNTGQKMF
ncbi:UNVERIFIED_CONTAM: hypothetical protein Sradi_3991600 [Sesamum radiatum]|uniref:Retrotransposon Copia-like N-terminal domain-containing protein n=1 Tax=Sesamum radiatum TaxID=300843 RepID=A0AAW2PHS1_SESRA